jgi:ADP-heptose:LPS heptosyltransferase
MTERIAVFRALMLGDLICATPALRALRRAHPDAHVTLVGLPWARGFAARLASVDDFVEFPGWPGLPERRIGDARALPRFLAEMRTRRLDLAVQLHGSGATVNALVAAFGARRNAGFASPRATCPPGDEERFADWPERGSEVERLLALADHLGLPRQGTHLDFPLRDTDREAAERLTAPLGGKRFVVVHPGSQLASRRWPPERFAAVADGLAREGLAIVLTGTEAELPLTRAVARAMRAPALDLAGRTTLGSLGALVEWAVQVVCNDTGISHVAAALGTPSTVVSSGGDALRWAPADRLRHRVFWRDLPCRPCVHRSCPVGHACALGIGVPEVRRHAVASAREALHA